MPKPKAFAPEYGYKYQILCRNQKYSKKYEHCDYAKDCAELKHLFQNYRLAYGPGWEFQKIILAQMYWLSMTDGELEISHYIASVIYKDAAKPAEKPGTYIISRGRRKGTLIDADQIVEINN